MFNVVMRDDLSLTDLAQIHRSGGSVQKSPHIGNVYTSNLAVGAMGIPMSLYDRTIGAKDKNFHPHLVIFGAAWEKIGDDSVLSTHNRVLREPELVQGWFRMGELALDGHLNALRSAVPAGDWFTYTSYLQLHIDHAVALCELAAEANPSIWQRYVDPWGHVYQGTPTNQRQVTDMGIYGVTNRQSGWLIPNVLNVICDTLIESQVRGVHEVYHLSGPDMVRYISSYGPMLHTLYEHIRHRTDWGLPNAFTINLTPVADMRFAVVGSRRDRLDALMEAWLAQEASNRSRANAFRDADPNEHSRLIGRFAAEKTRLIGRLRSAARDCPDVFYEIANPASVTTQYDVLGRGGLYVHPWVMEAPLRQVASLYKTLDRLRR